MIHHIHLKLNEYKIKVHEKTIHSYNRVLNDFNDLHQIISAQVGAIMI